jgi:hypothetical protein
MPGKEQQNNLCTSIRLKKLMEELLLKGCRMEADTPQWPIPQGRPRGVAADSRNNS